jgi:hypothetical protein
MIMGKCLGGPEGFNRRSEVLEVGGSGGRRFWRSEVLEVGGSGGRRFWRSEVLEVGDFRFQVSPRRLYWNIKRSIKYSKCYVSSNNKNLKEVRTWQR